MCGIAGFTGAEAGDRALQLEAMLDALDHRGPDDRGIHLDDDVGLGMTRLAIIDIGGGHQPKTGGDGRWVVVFNGEIYNFSDLRDELSASGVPFSTRSDSEVVAQAVAAWGTDAFERFDGMFAVAAWDRAERRLVLARDRFGEKPLYLWRRGSRLAFASELKALAAVVPDWGADNETFAEYLHMGYVASPRTMIEGVEKLPPAHVAVWDGRHLSTRRYWSPTEVEVGPPPAGDPVESFRDHLVEAVRSRLVADVDVGVLLSGGLDSSLVAWAAAQAEARLQTFSVAFDDPRRDESPYARAVSEHLGTDHHEIRMTADEARGALPDLVEIFDEPFADSSAIPTLLVSRFARSRVKVALAGDGGDELLSGYRRYGEVRTMQRAVRGVPRPLRGLLGDRAAGRPALATRGGFYLSLLGDDLAATYRNRVARMSVPRVGWLTGQRLRRSGLARSQKVAVDATPHRLARLADLEWYLPEDLLVKVDRASMSTSLEVRAPFLARDLAEWALRLPDATIGLPGTKALSRALAARVLPAAVASKPKQGFSVPLADWLRGPLRAQLEETVREGRAVRDGLVRPRSLGVLLGALDEAHGRAVPALWSLFVYERWFERWCAGRGAARASGAVPRP